MTRTLWLSLGLLAAVAALPASSPAAGGTYEVIQCSAAHRGDEAQVRQPRAYHLKRRCDQSLEDNAMKIESVFPASKGVLGAFSWSAPPHTGFVGVRVGARLRRDAGHRARLVMTDDQGRETYTVAAGGTGPATFSQRTWSGPPQRRFAARLTCQASSGSCRQSNLAKTWVRNLRLTLVDLADPVVDASGSLLGPGWKRGEKWIRVDTSDKGSGLAETSVHVNGVHLGREHHECWREVVGTSATRLSPCPASWTLGPLAPSTAHLPFIDGANSLAACAEDFAGNRACLSQTVDVDNTAPSLAFLGDQLPDDPELIRASVVDLHSGVEDGRIRLRALGTDEWHPVPTQRGGGILRARVDTAAYPAGLYEFKAEAIDIAGNVAETTTTEDGTPMILSFPLRSGVSLHARIEPGGQKRVNLAYGRNVAVVGRLLSRDGTPLVDREVRVEEYFGEGALIDRRVRTVRTDAVGRWRSSLPAGPSRSVRAYFDGDARYLGRVTAAGSLAVRSRARFRTSRNRVPQGRRVVFGGRIGRLGARVPAGGKLIELQVRERPGRWSTVREAFRTGPRGRYRLRYRFGRFYQRDVRFVFRVKVAREADWPYRPTASKPRRVTVLAR